MDEEHKVIEVDIKGTLTPVKIRTAISFKALHQLMKAFNLGGVQDTEVFFNTVYVLIKVAVIDGPFKDMDREAISELSADSVTKMVGEIRKIIPLEGYMKNLGLTAPQVEDALKSLK